MYLVVVPLGEPVGNFVGYEAFVPATYEVPAIPRSLEAGSTVHTEGGDQVRSGG
jgi:hypothetical protein